ncbi:hypothetical protein CPA40_02190 [Bifidobacterium callitrichos]|uniref:Methyl-accepting chemotaxis protein n=1 Tax=Bifidobacterium callitrichos TaxID=762209 RepID=A0A2T3GCE0_9BIFI|nr:hypothetical protein [Bifidobacterium callitrichos]PST47148.1 hypothetical protein CPA40_02190 [Bifidobacterium callitrichos]
MTTTDNTPNPIADRRRTTVRRILAPTIAAFLAAVLLTVPAMSPANAADTPQASAHTTAVATPANNGGNSGEGNGKDETVYIKTKANGAVSGVYVVNTFDAGQPRTVQDPGSYTKVTNLTTDEKLAEKNGKVNVTTLKNKPFYYQGDLKADTALPWNVSVDYTLDGRAVDARELDGADGELAMTLRIAPNESADKATREFADAYVIQAQGTFPQEALDITDAGDATLAQSGGNTVVSGMVLPGETGTFTIRGRAKDFTSSGWQITAMSLDMALDVRDQDTSQLTEQTGKLGDATAQLADGTASLAQGNRQLSQGIGSLATGTTELNRGAQSLASGTETLSQGAEALAQGNRQLADGLAQLYDASGRMSAGVKGLPEQITALSQGVTTLKQGSDTLKQGDGQYRQALAGGQQTILAQVGGDIDAAETASRQAYAQALAAVKRNPGDAQAIAALDKAVTAMAQVENAKGQYQALGQALDGYVGISSGIGQLSGGVDQLDAKVNGSANGSSDDSAAAQASLAQLANGLASMHTAIGQLNTGAQSAASGAEELAKGLSAARDGANSLATGAAAADSGARTLASGAASAADGADRLDDGARELADSVKGMDDKVLDELQKTIDEKLGKGFKTHSFVAPANTAVDRVQFTYVLPGIGK